MSVQTWKRKVSNAEYVYQVYQLNIRLGEILVNKPQKYKTNYTDEIVKAALSALDHLQTVDGIYLSKYALEQDFLQRRKHLLEARGKIEHIATACFVYLEIVRKHDYAQQQDDRLYAKLYDQELEIGELCETCYKLISGVIKADAELYRQYIRPKQAR